MIFYISLRNSYSHSRYFFISFRASKNFSSCYNKTRSRQVQFLLYFLVKLDLSFVFFDYPCSACKDIKCQWSISKVICENKRFWFIFYRNIWQSFASVSKISGWWRLVSFNVSFNGCWFWIIFIIAITWVSVFFI